MSFLEEYELKLRALGIERARLPDVMDSVVPQLGPMADGSAGMKVKPPPIAEDLSRFESRQARSGARSAKNRAFYEALDRAGTSGRELARKVGRELHFIPNWLNGRAGEKIRERVWALLNEEQRRAVPVAARPGKTRRN
jgi:hypothetical protein